MKIEKALFTTKFKEMTLNELRTLFPLKEVGLKELALLHVVEIEEVAFVPYGGYMKDEEQRLREEALSRFRDWSKEIEEKSLKVKPLLKVGVPWRSVLATAEEEGVNLIVLGAAKREEVGAITLGSTGMRVVRHSEFPVLILKEFSGSIFKRILIAIDFSLPSEKALGLVIALLPAVSDGVDLVHVVSEKEIRGLDQEEIARQQEDRKRNLEVYAKELRNQGVKASSNIPMGNTAKEILKAAKKFNSTLIVMGTTGKDGFKELWIGSSSHRVAELAQRPVLLVP